MEAYGGLTAGPAETIEASHHAAAVLVGMGRAADDPEMTARLVALVDELGLDTLAELWSARPARTLPGALWRLYALREWVRQDPSGASREYAAGMPFADVNHVVAGVAEPPGPQEVRDLADQILTGVYDGDLAIALDRAAAFCTIVAAGRAALADAHDGHDPQMATAQTRTAQAMLGTSEDLRASANLWREDRLL